MGQLSQAYERAFAIMEQAREDGRVTVKEILLMVSGWLALASAAIEALVDPNNPVPVDQLIGIVNDGWDYVDGIVKQYLVARFPWGTRMIWSTLDRFVPSAVEVGLTELSVLLDKGEVYDG